MLLKRSNSSGKWVCPRGIPQLFWSQPPPQDFLASLHTPPAASCLMLRNVWGRIFSHWLQTGAPQDRCSRASSLKNHQSEQAQVTFVFTSSLVPGISQPRILQPLVSHDHLLHRHCPPPASSRVTRWWVNAFVEEMLLTKDYFLSGKVERPERSEGMN